MLYNKLQIDKSRHVPFEIPVASTLPALRQDLERILNVDDEQG
jgi:hypothetical protein